MDLRAHRQRRLRGELEFIDRRRNRDEGLMDRQIGILRLLHKPLVGIRIAFSAIDISNLLLSKSA